MTIHETDTHLLMDTLDGYGVESKLYYCKCCNRLDSPDNKTPAKFVKTPLHNGTEELYEFYSHGVLHRGNDLPAFVNEQEVNEYGTLLTRKSKVMFYTFGKLDRKVGPAKVYYRNGFVTEKYFYKDGVKQTT